MRHSKQVLTFQINKPEFDPKFKPEFVSTPLKRVLLLTPPTKIKAIPPTEPEKQKHPATYVDPCCYSKILPHDRVYDEDH